MPRIVEYDKTLPLQPNADGIGSRNPIVHCVEWTPEVVATPVRSSWRGELGKPLISHRITQLMKEGHYGQSVQDKALARTRTSEGIVIRCCQCKSDKQVIYLRYQYLPHPGYYCLRCLKSYRTLRAEQGKQSSLNRQLEQRIKDAARQEYI